MAHVGQVFESREALSASGVHAPPRDAVSGDDSAGVFSLVLSAQHCHVDKGDCVEWTEQIRDKAVSEAEGISGNILAGPRLWLTISCRRGQVIRLVRASGCSEHGPHKGYRYEGLFRVSRHWEMEILPGAAVHCFRLNMATRAHIEQGKYRARRTDSAMADVSKRVEQFLLDAPGRWACLRCTKRCSCILNQTLGQSSADSRHRLAGWPNWLERCPQLATDADDSAKPGAEMRDQSSRVLQGDSDGAEALAPGGSSLRQLLLKGHQRHSRVSCRAGARRQSRLRQVSIAETLERLRVRCPAALQSEIDWCALGHPEEGGDAWHHQQGDGITGIVSDSGSKGCGRDAPALAQKSRRKSNEPRHLSEAKVRKENHLELSPVKLPAISLGVRLASLAPVQCASPHAAPRSNHLEDSEDPDLSSSVLERDRPLGPQLSSIFENLATLLDVLKGHAPGFSEQPEQTIKRVTDVIYALHAKFTAEFPSLQDATDDSTDLRQFVDTVAREVTALCDRYPLEVWIDFNQSLTARPTGDQSNGENVSRVLRALLQLRWLGLEWLHLLSTKAAARDQISRHLEEHARRTASELIPLIAVLPDAHTLEASDSLIDRPLLALWHRLLMALDQPGGSVVNTVPAVLTPFWQLVNRELCGAQTIIPKPVTLPKHAKAHSVPMHMLQWRLRCVCTLLPLYSLEPEEGGQELRGCTRLLAPNWLLLDDLLGEPLSVLHRASCSIDDPSAAVPPVPSEACIAQAREAATIILRLCCDLSSVWTSSFDAALTIWKRHPPPSSPCGSSRAHHWFPPFERWRCKLNASEVSGSPVFAASNWTTPDDVRTLALRFLTAGMLSVASSGDDKQLKRARSKLQSWASSRAMKVLCPATHRWVEEGGGGWQVGCIDNVWSHVAALLAFAESTSMDDLNAIAQIVKSVGSKLSLRDSGNLPSLMVFEAQVRLMQCAQNIGQAQLEKISCELVRTMSELMASRGSVAATSKKIGCHQRERAHGEDDIVLVVLERCSKLLQQVPKLPSSNDGGERLLLSKELAAVVRAGPTTLCLSALRVLAAALDSAIAPKIAVEDAVRRATDAGEDEDSLLFLLDEQLIFESSSADSWAIKVAPTLAGEAWFPPELAGSFRCILAERLLTRMNDMGLQAGKEGHAVDAPHEARMLAKCWARMEWLISSREAASAQAARFSQLARLLERHLDGASMAKRSIASAVENKLYLELRVSPIRFLSQFFACAGNAVGIWLDHQLEVVERLWFASMVEPTSTDQLSLTKELLKATRLTDQRRKLEWPRSVLLFALHDIASDALLFDRGSWSSLRLPALLTTIGYMARKLAETSSVFLRSRVEKVIHNVAQLMPNRLKELCELKSSELPRYTEFVLRITGRLFHQLPSVLAQGTMAELLVKQVLLEELPSVLSGLARMTTGQTFSPVGRLLTEVLEHFHRDKGRIRGGRAALSRALREPELHPVMQHFAKVLLLPKVLGSEEVVREPPSAVRFHALNALSGLEALHEILGKTVRDGATQTLLLDNVLPVLLHRLVRCNCTSSAECALAAELFLGVIEWLASPSLAMSSEARDLSSPSLLLQVLHSLDSQQRSGQTLRVNLLVNLLRTVFLMTAHTMLAEISICS
ncbi:MAG: hypothetical protein SGPRY_000733 [Prymnesium sp.]